MSIPVVELPEDAYPILAELFREDTGEVVWSTTILGPSIFRVPAFGGQGFIVRARVTYANGEVHEEAVPGKE